MVFLETLEVGHSLLFLLVAMLIFDIGATTRAGTFMRSDSPSLELLGVPARITNILFILLSSLPCSLSSYTCYPIYYHTL
jgi:hypothetical protein